MRSRSRNVAAVRKDVLQLARWNAGRSEWPCVVSRCGDEMWRHVKELRRRQPCNDEEEPRDEEGEDRDDEGTIRRSKRLEEQRMKTSAVILENQEGV